MTIKIIRPENPTWNLIREIPHLNADANWDLAFNAVKPVSILKRMGYISKKMEVRLSDPLHFVSHAIASSVKHCLSSRNET